MKQTVSTIAKKLLGIGLLFSVLYFVAAFSLIQSLILSFVLAVLYALIYASREARSSFIAYHMFVWVDLPALLTDFDLVKDTEESWAEVRAGIAELPSAPWNIWNSGLSVSFVTPELIYNNAWNSFSTEVEARAVLEPVGIGHDGEVVILRKDKKEDVLFRAIPPSLHLEPGNSGYRLSIELRSVYWEKVRHKPVFKEIADRDVDIDHMCGSTKIRLATIPYEEFGVHLSVRPNDSEKAYQDAVKRRIDARARFGWKGKAETDMYERETTAEHSNTIERRYFSVSHSAL